MSSALEYHVSVRRLFSPAAALVSLGGALVFLSPSSVAQINAPSSSVTSPGFGGRSVNGTSPSVTSVGPRGYVPKTTVPHAPINDGRQHRRSNGNYTGPYWYAVPYGVDPNAYADAPEQPGPNDESDYQGGPTVFDRRGSGARSYIPPVEDVPPPHSEAPSDQTVSAADPAPSTTLIFKDGHKLEIHAGDWRTRLAAMKLDPWEPGIEYFD